MTDIDEANGVSLEQAQNMLEELSAVNLDEISPPSVAVAFREFFPGPHGKGFTIETEHKEISTWVPMYLFNRMLANQKKVQKMRRQQARKVEFAVTTPEQEDEEEKLDLLADETEVNFAALTDDMFREVLASSDLAIVWQAREVLTIWKMTPGEEHMSLKKLMLGLTFKQIEGLFTLFFADLIRRRTSRA